MSLDVICEKLRTNIATLSTRADSQELLVIDDLFADVRGEAGTMIFCIDGECPIEDNELVLVDISPGLSFFWTINGVEKFGFSDRMKRAIATFRSDSQERFSISVLSGFTYLYTPDSDDVRQVIKELSRGMELLSVHSLNARNKYFDRLEVVSFALTTAVDLAEGNFGLLDLTRFLTKKTQLEFGLLHLNQSRETPLARGITVSAQSLSKQSLMDLSEFIGLQAPHSLIETSTSDSSPDPFPAVPLPQTVGSELIVNAGFWGKPLASALSGLSGRRILIVPITRPRGARGPGQSDPPTPAAVDLLFAFPSQIDNRLMDELATCVDTFRLNRYGARRFNLLTKIQSSADEPLAQSARPDGTGVQQIGPGASNTLTEILNEVLYTTSAHSVSVRLYDAATRRLNIAAAVNPMRDTEPGEPDRGIDVRRTETSVVAFTFLKAGPDMPFVYLRRIHPPARRETKNGVKFDNRTFIPPQYKGFGLQSPLITRATTRSELCFPLTKGQLAFGTFNLEAPYPAAFDQDLDYLGLVKSGIEKLYGQVDSRIDSRWLIANSARSESIHQLWQYQEDQTFFTEQQRNVLRAIFPSREENDLTGNKSITALKEMILGWVDNRYTDETLRLSVNRMIKFDHLAEANVDGHFFESAVVILRNLIQNAVKHGLPAEDLLIVDDRPWFGARRRSCLRIYYRSSQSVPLEVIQSLGVEPIQQDSGRRIGYGLYNVGLLSRLLGGTLHVSTPGGRSGFSIDIHLPISTRTH